MAGTVEDAEDDDAEDAGDDSAGISNALGGGVGLPLARPVSYTHLTLPTICSV